MYALIRPLFFRLTPEQAHAVSLNLIGLAGRVPLTRWMLEKMYAAPEKPLEVFGLKFKNRVGLAAGYDKDGVAMQGLATLGFGHIEIGTVTPRPQAGNPSPRVFRLVEDEGVINRMGFPGKGMDFVAARLAVLRKKPFHAVIGVNLGKNKDTPLEDAAQDYILLMRRFMRDADYLAINISSPNTVGLRRLQGREMLEGLLGALADERAAQVAQGVKNTPILVKIAPDLTDEELDDAVGAVLARGMDGIIATNTTLSRAGVRSALREESGGLSGKPLTALSDLVLEKVVKRVDARVAVIGVGGVMNPDDAKRKIDLGATLVQVYSGLVYAGPALARDICRAI
jgi:dihydroorotate dehydrogenase